MSTSQHVGYGVARSGTWGQLDMVGEVWEWTVDWYASYASTCTDCAYLSASSYRVIRGGNFDDSTSYLLPPPRRDYAPACRDFLVGFRCARTP